MIRLSEIPRYKLYFSLIILLSIVLKFGLLLHPQIVNPDAATYIAAAQQYSQGLFQEGLRFYRMPFYPLLLSGMNLIFSDWILSGHLLTIIPFVLVLFPLYGVTERLFDRQSALWTILLFSVLPNFNSLSIKRDPLFLLFAITALYFLISIYRKHDLKSFFSFIVFGVLATLTRIEGILLFGVLLTTLFFYLRESKKSRAVVVSFAVVFCGLAVLLWWAGHINLAATSRLGEVTLWLKSLLDGSFFSQHQRILESIKTLQETLPGSHLKCNLLETTRHYTPLIYIIGMLEIAGKTIFPVSLLAFVGYRWNRDKYRFRQQFLIWVPCLAYALLNLLFLMKRNFIQTRYLWISIVLILPWVGCGISLWWQRYEKKKVVALLVSGLIIFSPMTKTLGSIFEDDDLTIITAGEWLRNYDPDRDQFVFYNDRRLALYADRVSEILRVRDIRTLKRSIPKNEKVDVVALYFSNKRQQEYSINGFDVVKLFRGSKKTVVFLKRVKDN